MCTNEGTLCPVYTITLAMECDTITILYGIFNYLFNGSVVSGDYILYDS